jgi:hypothetical protein
MLCQVRQREQRGPGGDVVRLRLILSLHRRIFKKETTWPFTRDIRLKLLQKSWSPEGCLVIFFSGYPVNVRGTATYKVPFIHVLRKPQLTFTKTLTQHRQLYGDRYWRKCGDYSPFLLSVCKVWKYDVIYNNARSRGITIDGVWVGEWLYWPPVYTTRNDVLHINDTHRLLFSVYCILQ